VLPGRFHHYGAGHDQDFLVRQRNGLTCSYRCEDSIQPGRTRRRAEHDVDRWMRRDGNQAVPARLRVCRFGDCSASERPPDILERLPARHSDDLGLIACDLIGEPLGVAAGRERNHAQAIRMGVDDRQRTLADRAR
jgi:hypothetical protein